MYKTKKCLNNNQSQILCCCYKRTSYICNSYQCQCFKKHSRCKNKINFNQLKDQLNQKIATSKYINKQSIEEVTNTYYILQKKIEMQINAFNSWVGTFGLSDTQIKIFRILHNDQIEQLTPQLINEYNEQKNTKPIFFNNNFPIQMTKIIQSFGETLELMKSSYQYKFKNTITSLLVGSSINSDIIKNKDIQKLLKILEEQQIIEQIKTKKSEEQLQIQNKRIENMRNHYLKQYNKIVKKCRDGWMDQIIKCQQIIDKNMKNINNGKSLKLPTLESFQLLDFVKIDKYKVEKQLIKIQSRKIKKKKPKFFHLLYRASEHAFRIKQFWNKCNQKSNTLILIKTQYDQIIGGFTPLKWDKQKNNKYQYDNFKQSFLFSLTLNEKFRLLKQEKAIFNDIQQGPLFGTGPDLSICDRANQSGLSQTYVNNSYKNKNFENYKNKFSGSPSVEKFKIKQWEVFQVQFFEQVQTIKINNT